MARYSALDLQEQEREIARHHQSGFESPFSLETIVDPVRACTNGHILGLRDVEKLLEAKKPCYCSEPIIQPLQRICQNSWPVPFREVTLEHTTDIVLVDCSSSMQWSDTFFRFIGESRLDVAKRFLLTLSRARLASQARMAPANARHSVMLCSFGSTFHIVQEPRTTAAELEMPIRLLQPTQSDTFLYDALREAIAYIKGPGRLRDGHQYRLIVLTDGADTGSQEQHRQQYENWFNKEIKALQIVTTVYSLSADANQYVKQLVYKLPSSLGFFRSLTSDVDPENMAREYVEVLHKNYEKMSVEERKYLAPAVTSPQVHRKTVVTVEPLPSVPTHSPRSRNELSNMMKRPTLNVELANV